MKKSIGRFLLCLVTILAGSTMVPTAPATGLAKSTVPGNAEPKPEEPKAVLMQEDCRKCHDRPFVELEKKGGAHRTEVTCIQCHEEHPPTGWQSIPLCSKCHVGQDHFTLIFCYECHRNPHQPKVLTLTTDLTEPCLTCHDQQIMQLQDYPSFHSKLACSACHFEHGLVPPCGRCHEPHSEAMSEADCHHCHRAHRPLAVSYGPEVPSEYCGACHQEVFTVLGSSPTRHRQVACVECHATRHGSIPECGRCHGAPHPEAILGKFPACGACHGLAHDLNPTARDTRPRRGAVGRESGQ